MLAKLRFISLIVVCWMVARLPLFARQAKLSSTVLDASGRRIAGARILSAEGVLIATADANGDFNAHVSRGTVIQVQADGFLPLRVSVSQMMVSEILGTRILMRAMPVRKPFERTGQISAFRSQVPVAANLRAPRTAEPELAASFLR